MKTRFYRENSTARLVAVVVLLGAVFLGVSAPSVLADRPPNPTLDYVPQNLGIYDTYYGDFQTVDCRVCHGDRNAGAQRHQLTASAFADCPDGSQLPPPSCLAACHPDPNNPETITDNCFTEDCHPTVDNDMGGTHHKTDWASSGQCTACHRPDLLVDLGSVKPPAYYPTAYTATPTPYDCENCHWPTNCDEVLPDRLDPRPDPTGDVGRVVTSVSPTCADDDVLFELDWSTWPHPDPSAPPAPIVAHGTTQWGPKNPNKPYLPITGTHHELSANMFGNCHFCHAANPGSPIGTDPSLPRSVLYIRYCQNCHSAESLHGINEHMQTNNIYTVGGVLNQQVTDSAKCVGCHGEVPATAPVVGPKPPVITGMNPIVGPGGSTSCTITGENFGTSGDVLLAPKMVGAGQAYRITAAECTTWTNSSVGFIVPPGLTPQNYNVRVETSTKLSNLRVFTLTGPPDSMSCPSQAPVINSIAPSLGAPGAIVTIHGESFGEFRTDREVEGIHRKVQMRRQVGPSYYWGEVPIYSWAENQIKFFLPGGSFWPVGSLPYTSQIRVETEIGQSNTEDSFVRRTPRIFNLDHQSPDNVTLDGSGFYDQRQGIRPDGYGWESNVILVRPGDTISVDPANITSWSQVQIQMTIPGIEPDFYGVSVETLYFYDTDGNSQYSPGVDQVYQIDRSDPVLLQLISVAVVTIDKILPLPKEYEPGKIIRIIGAGFGDSQGESVLHIGPKTFNSNSLRIKDWSDTKIRFRLPFKNKLCGWYKHGDGQYKKRKVWVTVDSGGMVEDSNVKRLRVMKPAGCQ